MAQISLYRPLGRSTWGNLDHLHREMDDLFRRFGVGSPLATSWRGVFPPVNLYETPDEYVLTAELPGVGPEDIRVSIEGSTVSLKGERKIAYPEPERTSVHRAERQAGSFQRAFELPAAIDPDRVEAVQRNGVLMLHLPKTSEARPRQISIKAG